MFSIRQDGSAEFNKSVRVGGNPLDGQDEGSFIRSGSINICKDDYAGNATNAFVIQKKDDTVPNCVVRNDGSISINPDSLDSDSIPVDSKVLISSDGSVMFAGRGDFGSDNYTTTHAVQAQNNKSDRSTVLAIQHNPLGTVFEGRNGDVSTTFSTSAIYANGNTSFQGLAEWRTNSVLKCRVNPLGVSDGGEISLNNSAGSSTIHLYGHDGSASFANGSAKLDIVSGGGGLNVSADGSTLRTYYGWNNAIGYKANATTWKLDNNTGNITGNVLRSAGFQIELERDNDANYVTTTDVDEEGNTVETRVYNGPTLDVKAVIQELQQRVNDRDSVIADLTTRIQTLEGGNN